MIQTPTVHNAAKSGDIAPKVLMPGDPQLARMIAENYLYDRVRFNSIRGALGYTGLYRGERVSVMTSGMGMPSTGLYAQELYEGYGVEEIIRVGTAGRLQENLPFGQLIVAISASTDSAFANAFHLPGTFAPTADFGLVQRLLKAAEYLRLPVEVGNILSSDRYYMPNPADLEAWKAMGVQAMDMETAALYLTAAKNQRKAASLVAITDDAMEGKRLTGDISGEEALRRLVVTALKA